PEQQKELEAQGRKYVIRFRMPEEGDVEWDDMIRGHVKFASKDLYDLVIQKTSGYPTYNFAVVIDDHLMGMTHVIRGDDHISNTPSQIQIYRALGWKEPVFAHLSMIHGPDGKKLSKRHGATNVVEFRNMGYLPEALKNYLALLGWATSDSQQIFAAGELEEKFDISGCQPSPAVMDPEKLNWMNGEYIRATPIARLTDLAMPFIEKAGIDVSKTARAKLEGIIGLEQEKYKLLTEIPDLIRFFFEDPVFEPEAVEKVFGKPEAKQALTLMIDAYGKLEDFTEANLEAAARTTAKENGLKAGQIFHPVRVAVSGRTHGPTLFKMLEYMGKDVVLARLNHALSYCK
ncbi:MAG: glutamate--tRNA ligase, partial [Candidatus Avelusimicrobium sp.]